MGIVFFSPLELMEERLSGSAVRPGKMMEAFEQVGATVIRCIGPSWARRKIWAEVFAREKGIAGVYAELATLPVALTDPDHLPRAVAMDSRAFQRCRARGWPVGAFYRDVYWRFPEYRVEIPLWKRIIPFPFYHLELWQLRRSVDHFFLPSVPMLDFIPGKFPAAHVSALPPGAACLDLRAAAGPKQPGALHLLYVGGIGPPLYDLTHMFRAVDKLEGVTLTVCCRKSEWVKHHSFYGPTRGLEVVHTSGAGLNDLYVRADAFLMALRPTPYRRFAMPVKLFEAMGAGVPIIASADTAAGRLVLEEKIGWVVGAEEELVALLARLRQEPDSVAAVRERVRQVRENHTWRARARQVLTVLESYRRYAPRRINESAFGTRSRRDS